MKIADLEVRLRLYLNAANIASNVRPLGFGQDGAVWQSTLDRATAVKVFEREENYLRELDCYLRLKERGVSDINGFTVPQLVGYHDEFWVIEMTIVEPPCVYDFGKAYLDQEPSYWKSFLGNLDDELRNLHWAPERIKAVRSIVFHLLRYGIFYVDPRPGNIRFQQDDELPLQNLP